MQRINREARWTLRSIVGLACWIALVTPTAAADPIDDLRQALPLDEVNNPTETMLQFRRDNLQKKIDALKTIGQLRRALALDDWRDDLIRSADPKIRRIDTEMRTQVGKRLRDQLEAQVKTGDVDNRMAIANLIAEMGPTVRALNPEDKGGYARSLAPLVAQLVKDPDLNVRQEALRALGNLHGNPKAAVQVFAHVLQNDAAVGARRAAAEGLSQMVRVVIPLQKRNRATASVEATRPEVLESLQEVIQTSPIGYTDADAQVRIRCAKATLAAVQMLADEQIPEVLDRKNFPPSGRALTEGERPFYEKAYEQLRREIDELRPVLATIREKTPALTPLLNDADLATRRATVQTLMQSALVRQRLRQFLQSLPTYPGEKLDGGSLLVGADPLELFLKNNLGAVAPLFSGGDVDIRKSAAIFLLLLDDSALPQIHLLIDSLNDPERTIRWIAARALSNLPPDKTTKAVPGLVKMLSDSDVVLRLGAAKTLEGMGSFASAAVGALAKTATQGDAESRLAALQALAVIGPDATQSTVPQLNELLGQRDADTKVLIAAMEVLAQIGPPAKNAMPALRRLIGHEDAEVRTAASEAILTINVAGKN